MTTFSTETPLRVAIIGSGPAAFYAAEHLLKQANPLVEVDMFDRLPTPFGLVRAGVAPDHQKIKGVTKVFDQLANNARFRFYGGVEYGKHLHLDDLKAYYHQVLFATGAQTDRHMGIPGEDLRGSHPATEFVAWYNGHPDYRDLQFDLQHERAAVVGVGNVAIDVARILCLTPEEMRATDMADYAIEAISQSRIKEVLLLGRRGPAQAAFTTPEVKEIGNLHDADAFTLPDEIALDPLSQAEVDAAQDREVKRKLEIMQSYSLRTTSTKSRRLVIRFLVSPVELRGDASGHVTHMRLVKNRLVKGASGALSAQATDQFEEIPVGIVFRSVGYRGVALPGIPFNEKWGVILNEKGRVLDATTNLAYAGLYTTGWIKRGPSGVIGTNKPDSIETAAAMLADAAQGQHFTPTQTTAEAATALVQARQPAFFSFADWRALDALEQARGKAAGRPRVKFTSVAEMLHALGR